MTGSINPQARLRWIEEAASKLPAGSFINISLAWENDHGAAGIHSYQSEAAVYLNGAEHEVESLDEAVSILRRIFADEVVAVTAFARGQAVYCALAPVSNPSDGFGVLDGHSSSADMPQIDHVMIETWSSGLQEPDNA